MHVRVRMLGKPDTLIFVESRLTTIENFRHLLKGKLKVPMKLQRLLYGGKLLEDGYTFHDYNIKVNDVIQLIVWIEPEPSPQKENKNEELETVDAAEIDYKDAVSVLYAIGDLIDMRDRELGAWLEGKIVKIIHDPDAPSTSGTYGCKDIQSYSDEETANQTDDENDLENQPPGISNGEISYPKKIIAHYFKGAQKATTEGKRKFTEKLTDENLLYKVQLDDEKEDPTPYCKLHEIRPRARTVIETDELKVGQEVMINYNLEHPIERGYWYDFKINEIIHQRKKLQLNGTLFVGPDEVYQHDLTVDVREKIFAIEKVVPLRKRNEEYQKMMATPIEQRTPPLVCLNCRDDGPCKDCGCFVCSGKENPNEILLCDECNHGFHLSCLVPPLTEVPPGDWYCSNCKRDPNAVIAPGASKQLKKSSGKSNRDWGRGMACVGKTKTSAMPANHFGPIPGVEVGMCWRFRIQLSECGVHRPPVSGIHGRDVDGAYSIVLSGGYEDDVDFGDHFTYTGSGGRDLSGNKRTAVQSYDQTLTRENKALARNCAVIPTNIKGADAGNRWREGKPVRVCRSSKMLKHFPTYAPKEGIRYDGIYKVVKYYSERGLSGFNVWKYLLRRDDPSPAPWEPTAKQYPIVYPDGYLEAQAEKKALKESQSAKRPKGKKRPLRTNDADFLASHSEAKNEEVPSKKFKKSFDNTEVSSAVSTNLVNGRKVATNAKAAVSVPMSVDPVESEDAVTSAHIEQASKKHNSLLTDEQRKAICADYRNYKLWANCFKICERLGKNGFIEHVTQEFLCIICQNVVANPVTTICHHNFCMGCLAKALRSNSSCPCCRLRLENLPLKPNEQLKAALRAVLPGYDAGRPSPPHMVLVVSPHSE